MENWIKSHIWKIEINGNGSVWSVWIIERKIESRDLLGASRIILIKFVRQYLIEPIFEAVTCVLRICFSVNKPKSSSPIAVGRVAVRHARKMRKEVPKVFKRLSLIHAKNKRCRPQSKKCTGGKFRQSSPSIYQNCIVRTPSDESVNESPQLHANSHWLSLPTRVLKKGA